MTTTQLKTYITGVLKGWINNKSTLDKLSESEDGKLLFNSKIITNDDTSSSDYLPLSGGTINGSITFTGNQSVGILSSGNNYGKIGDDDKRFYRSYINNMYGACIYLTSNASATSTSYNGLLKCATLTADRTYYLPDESGIILLTSSLANFNSTITFGDNNNYGIRASTNNYASIGANDKRFFASYINNMYGADIYLSSNESLTNTSYNGKLKCITLTANRTYILPDKDGTILLTSDLSNYINNGESIYSTDETIVGKWIDGKPLYQKTINFGSLPNSTTKYVSHSITNIDNIWVHDGFTNIDGNYFGPLVYSSNNAPDNYAFYVNKTQILCETHCNRSTETAYVTLRYTKTTD